MSEEKELIEAIGTLKDTITKQADSRKKRDLKWLYTLILLVVFIFAGFATMVRRIDQISKNEVELRNKVDITDFNSTIRTINYNFGLTNLKEPPYELKELPNPKFNK